MQKKFYGDIGKKQVMETSGKLLERGMGREESL